MQDYSNFNNNNNNGLNNSMKTETLENKWRMLDSIKNEVDMVYKLENNENSMKLTEINLKL